MILFSQKVTAQSKIAKFISSHERSDTDLCKKTTYDPATITQKDTKDSQSKKQTDLECIDAVKQILLDVDAKDLRSNQETSRLQRSIKDARKIRI